MMYKQPLDTPYSHNVILDYPTHYLYDIKSFEELLIFWCLG